jgi:hypothetical protein
MAQAQSRERYGNIDHGLSSVDESSVITDTDNTDIRPQNELGYKSHIEPEHRPAFGNGIDLSEYIIYSMDAEKYLASFRITDLLLPGSQRPGRDDGNGLIMIGVKKPYYSISRSPYIKGRLDFRLGGSFFGVENRGLIAITYYLRTEKTLRDLSSSVTIERLSFSVNFPF